MRSQQWDDWVQRAKSVPIESVLADRGIKLKGRSSPRGSCPQCGGHDRFSISPRKGLFHCRGCGHKGDVIALICFLDNVDFKHACETLTHEPAPTAKKKPNGKDDGSNAKPAATKQIRVAAFGYHDRDGKLVLVVERREFRKSDGSYLLDAQGKREKKFLQRRPDPEHPGKWIWNA